MKKLIIKPLILFSSLCLLTSFSQVGQAQNLTNIRVGLAMNVPRTMISASKPAIVEALIGGHWQPIGSLTENISWPVFASGRLLSVRGRRVQRLKVKPSSDSSTLIFADNHWYRGEIELFASYGGKGLTIVNQLPIKDYLYGVVPAEMPATWPLEALKAQAIAARTYAIKHLGSFAKHGFDVMDTVQSQVYRGAEGEALASNKAVDQTQGEVIVYNNEPIHAYFFSTSGGQTENGFELWGPFPYLKAVKDFDHQSPKYIWTQRLTQHQLRKGLAQLKINVGNIRQIQPIEKSQTGRINKLRIVGSHGSRIVKGMSFRLKLKINSTFFNVGGLDAQGNLIPEGSWQYPHSFQFVGRGWGHAMGLSQWGARQMAKDGSDYQKILKHYYTGVEIKKIDQLNLRFASDH